MEKMQNHIEALRATVAQKDEALAVRKIYEKKLMQQVKDKNEIIQTCLSNEIALYDEIELHQDNIVFLSSMVLVLVFTIFLLGKSVYDRDVIIENQDIRTEWLIGEYNRMNHENHECVPNTCLKRISSFEKGLK